MNSVKIPTLKVAMHYLGYGVLIYLLFAFVYGGTNWLASQRTDLFHFYFDWELGIPFIPSWIYVYLSMSLFIIVPMFVIREHELTSLLWADASVIMVAGSLCLFFPTEAGVIRPAVVMGHEAPFALLYFLDLPYNLFPSLHVSLTTLCMLALFFPLKGGGWLLPILLWWAAMLVSVLFVHQHYLADVLGGLVVGCVCYKYVYLKLCCSIVSENDTPR